MDDKEIACVDCSQDFTWTGKEQDFYASKQLMPPKRCKPCREAKKAKRGAQ